MPMNPREMLFACGMVGILDSDLAHILSVDPRQVQQWHEGGDVARRYQPQIVALLEATWTKMYYEAKQRGLGEADELAIQEILPALHLVCEPVKRDPILRPLYRKTLLRMLDALEKTNNRMRVVVPGDVDAT